MTAAGAVRAPVTVAFAGARGGESSLTWGQAQIWRAIRLMGAGECFLNRPWVLPVHGRRDLATVLDALRVLLERHESLRTTFADTPAGAVQRVARHGELPVTVVDAEHAAAEGERPRDLAARIAGELARTPFAHAEEPPLRCAVVTRGGRPMALAFAFSHLAADAWALDLLAAEWRSLLAGESLPPPAWQPMDQAAFEAGYVCAARCARAVEYWRSALRDVPLDVFDFPPGEPDDPRFVEVVMESPALAVAAELLAARWTISTTSVLLGACATVLAGVAGRSRAVMQLVTANRRDPRISRMVGTAGQDGLFLLDLPETGLTQPGLTQPGLTQPGLTHSGLTQPGLTQPGLTHSGPTQPGLTPAGLAGICRAAHRRALVAYRNAHYDPAAMDAMRAEIGLLRGREPDLDAFFNDRRAIGGWPNRPAVATAAELAVLAGKTRTRVSGAWPGVRFKAFFTVGTATHTGELHLLTDTAYLRREAAESMLRQAENLLVGAAAEILEEGA